MPAAWKPHVTTLQLALAAAVGLEGLATALLTAYAKRADARSRAAVERAEEALAVRKGMRRTDTPQ